MKIRGVWKCFFLFFFLFSFVASSFSQPKNKFSRKISGYWSKEEIEKAECFCDKQKRQSDKASCYSELGQKALDDYEFESAYDYFFKANDSYKIHKTIVEATESNARVELENHILNTTKEKNIDLSEDELNKKVFMPLADICYKQKDYKNAALYYEKADHLQLTNECKVLNAVQNNDFMTAVEISENETVGIKKTQEYYTLAAEQYYKQGDYNKALKCYKKIGDKSKVKACFTKGQRKSIESSLESINANLFNYSEEVHSIASKQKLIHKEIESLNDIAEEYKAKGFKSDAEYWSYFARQVKNLLSATANDSYLINPQSENLNSGEVLLTKAWDEVKNLTGEANKKIGKNRLKTLKYLLDELSETKQLYKLKVSNIASGMLNNASSMEISSYNNARYTIKKVETMMDSIFVRYTSTDSLENFYFDFCSLQKLHESLNEKIGNMIISEFSVQLKVKLAELKKAHIEYYNQNLKKIVYFKEGYAPRNWRDYLVTQKVSAIKLKAKTENSKMISQKI